MTIKLKDLLKENSKSKYDYGCVMLYFDFPDKDKIHSLINPQHIYEEVGDRTYGLEDEPHVTLLYGLHEGVTVNQVTKALSEIKFGPLIAHNASLFENENYDVLKFDMRYPVRSGNFLNKANQSLKQFPFTSNFPNYHPHMTVGYIQPGSGNEYVNKLSGLEYNIDPNYGVYSQPDGTKIKFNINK